MHLKLKGFEDAIIHSSFATTCLFGGKNLMNISRYIRGSADKWVHSRQKDFNDWRGAKIPTYNKHNSLTAKKVSFLSRIPFKADKESLKYSNLRGTKSVSTYEKGFVKKETSKALHRGWKCPFNSFSRTFLKKVFHTLKLVREFKFYIWMTISGSKSVKKSQKFLKKATNWT